MNVCLCNKAVTSRIALCTRDEMSYMTFSTRKTNRKFVTWENFKSIFVELG